MITTIDKRHHIAIPYELKDAFKKVFPSSKWVAETKKWSVGSRSLEKLTIWAETHKDKINADLVKKDEFQAKLKTLVKLTGKTFELKDTLKEKFNAIFHSYTQNNVVYDGWYVDPSFAKEAQELVNEFEKNLKEEKKVERNKLKYVKPNTTNIVKILEVIEKLHNDAVDEVNECMPRPFLNLVDKYGKNFALTVTHTVLTELDEHLKFADINDSPEITFFKLNEKNEQDVEDFLRFYDLSNTISVDF